MKKYDYINKNLERLKFMMNKGMAFTSALNHLTTYKVYDNYREKGFTRGQAIKLTAVDLEVTVQFIRKVCSDMEHEVEEFDVIKFYRKQLIKRGYSLAGNIKKGYRIVDKYTKVAQKISSLDEIRQFLE